MSTTAVVNSVIYTQLFSAIGIIVSGLAFWLLLGSKRVLIIRRLVIALVFTFSFAVVWGRVYVHNATSIAIAEINRNPGKAVDTLTNALRVDPSSPVAHFKRGFAYLKEKDPGRAYPDLRVAVDVPRGYRELRSISLAEAARQIGNVAESVSVSSKIIDDDPGNFDALNARGMGEVILGEYEKAIADFKSALAVANDAQTKFIAESNLAIPLTLTNRFEEALTHLKAADAVRPDDPQILAELGNTYGDLAIHGSKIGSHQLALQYADRALALDPASEIALLVRAAALAYLGQRSIAIDIVSKVIEKHPGNGQLLSERAKMYTQEGLTDLALKDLQAASHATSAGQQPTMLSRQ